MNGPRVISDQTLNQVLPNKFQVRSKNQTTVNTLSIDVITFENTTPVLVDNFKGGQLGQRLIIYGDGFTTIKNTSRIVTASGADTLLAANTISEFVYFNDAWREKGSGGGGGGGSTTYPLSPGLHISGLPFDGSAPLTWDIETASGNFPDLIVRRDGAGNFSANIISAALAGNADTATKLIIPRNIWGNTFDGTADIGGSLIPMVDGVSDIGASTFKFKDAWLQGNIDVVGSGLVRGGFNSEGTAGATSTRIGPAANALGISGIAIGNTALAGSGIRIGQGGPTANAGLVIGHNPSVVGTLASFRDDLISIGKNNVQKASNGVQTGHGNIILGNSFPGVDFNPLEQSTIAIGNSIISAGRTDILIGHDIQMSAGNFAAYNTVIGINTNVVNGGNSVIIGSNSNSASNNSRIVIGGANTVNHGAIVLGLGVTSTGEGQVFFGGPSLVMTEFYFGRGQAASFTNIAIAAGEDRFVKFTDRTTASNVKAGDIYFDAPAGTGISKVSDFIFRTSIIAATAGTTAQAKSESFRITRLGVKVTTQLEASGRFYFPSGIIFKGNINTEGEFWSKKLTTLGSIPGVVEFSDITSSVNLTRDGSSLLGYLLYKETAGGFGWNEQAYSTTGFIGNGTNPAVASAKAGLTTFSEQFFGLSVNPLLNPSYTSIDYAFYFENGNLHIYELGVLIGTFGTYTTSQVYTISYDGSNVIYRRDAAIIRTVAAPAGLLLYFDSSFNRPGSYMKEVSFKGPDQFGGDVDVQGKLISTITPKTTNLYDLGTSALKFKDGWFEGNVNVAEVRVATLKVVGAQQAAIADAAGGTEITTINAILTALRTHGLIAT